MRNKKKKQDGKKKKKKQPKGKQANYSLSPVSSALVGFIKGKDFSKKLQKSNMFK